jgi:lysophospholipase L1-like esterase
MLLSDPIELKVPSLASVTIDLHLPTQQMHTASWHSFADQSNSVRPVGAASAVKLTACWTFLKGIQVKAQASGRTIVAFGDSITDGVHSTKNRNARWPDVVAERLAKASAKDTSLRGLGVANEGIGGNRILENAAGPDGLARFDRDVLAQPNVRYLILFEGINDIGNMPVTANSKLLAARMIGGYEQMIERAHAHGILVYGATLTPYEGAAYATAAGEEIRRQVNE